MEQASSSGEVCPNDLPSSSSLSSSNDIDIAPNVDGDQQNDSNKDHGHASVPQTVVNMAKTCMGTGCLALPFAAKQGGILLHIFGLLLVGIWNVVTVQRLCQCYDLVMMMKSSNNVNDTTPSNAAAAADDDDDDLWVDGETTTLKRSNRTVLMTSTASSSDDFSIQSYYYDSTQEEGLAEGNSNSSNNNSNKSRPKEPPQGTTTLVKLAWYAMGQAGANLLDVIMVLYLIGVIVTYLNAMRSFLRDSGFTTGLGSLDSFLLVIIMGPISVVPHTGHLVRASAMGLLVLLATFLVIAWYGFIVSAAATTTGGSNDNNDDEPDSHNRWHIIMTTDDSSLSSAAPSITAANNLSISAIIRSTDEDYHHSIWFPRDGLAGVSQWFGCVVFGFGIAPLTFNFREAMEEPPLLVSATWRAMVLVSCSYIVVGAGLLVPYPDIQGDVLHELPSSAGGSWLPTITRLAMVLVVLATAPLLIVPCGELLEGKFVVGSGERYHYGLGNSNSNSNSSEDNGWGTRQKQRTPWRLKAIVRWSLCIVCASISIYVPGFVDVLSFVGCCCVAVVGFCLPPFLHLILSLQTNATERGKKNTTRSAAGFAGESLLTSWSSICVDVALLLWGLLATVVSTLYTFRELSPSPSS